MYFCVIFFILTFGVSAFSLSEEFFSIISDKFFIFILFVSFRIGC